MSINGNVKLSPFVKWVGGKRDVIKKHLNNLFPKDFKRYIEPFCGGAAVLFHLKPNEAIVNDINSELITTFKVIKNDVEKLVTKLDELKNKHSKQFYNEMRKEKPENEIDIAARFIYLNKSSFNGMYRVNSKGEFNVPFNKKSKEKLVLYDKENMLSLSSYFNDNKIDFYSKNYKDILNMAKEGDFVFIDPPYDYEDNLNGFTSYTKDGFDKQDQEELAKLLIELDKKKVKWMHTNHNTKLIQEIYKGFIFIPIKTNRNINSKGNLRKDYGDEVVITNFVNESKKLSEYISTLQETNIKLNDFVDFNQILKNVNNYELDLFQLDYIIHSSKDEVINRIKNLYKSNKSCFNVLPLLIAIKDETIFNFQEQIYEASEFLNNEQSIIDFIVSSNLMNLITSGKIKRFIDYFVGVEVGKYTNSRKNVFGKKNEIEIEKIIEKEFGKYDFIEIKKQLKIEKEREFDFLLNKIHEKGSKTKKFDIYLKNKNNNKIVLIETSFYNSEGSKISETCRSFAKIFNQINEYKEEFKFIWVADGKGMKSIKNELEEEIDKDFIFNKSSFIDKIKVFLELD